LHGTFSANRPCGNMSATTKRGWRVRGTTFLKWAGFCAGCLIALEAIVSIMILGRGDASEGATFMLAGSVISTALAVPLLALPFSMRFARLAFLAVLVLFAAGMLWLVFTSTRAQWTHQLAAVAFAVLLLVRIGLKRRAAST